MNIRKAIDYIQSFLKIKTKENKVLPFILNEPQAKLYDVISGLHKQGKPIRLIILKARQMGFSTLTEAIIFHRTATKENVNSLIITHKEDATTNLFNMSKLFYELLPTALKPMKKASNAKELLFENPTKDQRQKQVCPGLRSKIRCATAGGLGVGRSDTLTNVHASEFAFWEGNKFETLSGLLQAVPSTPSTMIIIESTANGFDEFKKMWDMAVSGENDFTPVFFAWFELEEYRKPYDGFKLTSEEKQIKKAYSLDNEQLSWRRWCIKNNCNNDEDKFKQEYPSCPEEAFLTTGNCYFGTDGKEKIILRIRSLENQKVKQGYFTYKTWFDAERNAILIDDNTIRFIGDSGGAIKIFKEPIAGYPYVIGGDTAGSDSASSTSDFYVGQVINNVNGEQVACLREKLDDDEYAAQMYCLGKFYNTALIAIEKNYTLQPIKKLQQFNYPRQYFTETVDEITNKIKFRYGFLTTERTRPLILADLRTIVKEQPHLINDVDTLEEMLVFVKNARGRPEAIANEHDDCVMALAIAFFARSQQTAQIKNAIEEHEEYKNSISDFINY